MCSTPKGRSGRSHHSSAVNGLTSNMSAAEYSSMVQRANESYERRQKELAKIRAARKQQPAASAKPPHTRENRAATGLFFDWLKRLFQQQNGSSVKH